MNLVKLMILSFLSMIFFLGSCKPKEVNKPKQNSGELPACTIDNLLDEVGNLNITDVKRSDLSANGTSMERVSFNEKHQGFRLSMTASNAVDYVRYRICTRQGEEVCFPSGPNQYIESFSLDEYLAIPPEIKGPVRVYIQACTEHSADNTTCADELSFDPPSSVIPIEDPSTMTEFSRQNAMNQRLLQIGSEIVSASEAFIKNSPESNSKIHVCF